MYHRFSLTVLTCILCLIPVLGQDGQTAHYRFEGNGADSSAFQRHLENGGGVRFAPGRFGQAAVFDGSSTSYLFVDPSPWFDPSEGFSISVWIRPEPGSSRMRIADTRGTGKGGQYEGWQFRIGEKSGQWGIRGSAVDDGSGSWKSCGNCGSGYDYGAWYHVVMVYEANQELRFYINGQLDATTAVGAYGTIRSDLPFSIGAAIAKNGVVTQVPKQAYKGLLDEMRVFGRALSEEEIEQLANEPDWAPSRDMYVDFVSETSGATQQMGYFFLDIDSSGNGIPDFLSIGDFDDLDGDLIVNLYDWDDDGDNIPDTEDRAGYDFADGSQAGYAPPEGMSVPAAFFVNGPQAAAAGLHVDDYWQFVPNGVYEQRGAPYQDSSGNEYPKTFVNPGAYLYVDEFSPLEGCPDGIPDVLQQVMAANTVPAGTLDKDWETGALSGEPMPGLLGSWSGYTTGATIFYVCDDDLGPGSHPVYNDFTPYREGETSLYNDTSSEVEGNPDYFIYGTDDETTGEIPEALLSEDAIGERLWRYRWQGDTVSDQREVVYFLNTYWSSGGQYVNTYYSKTEFNPDVASGVFEPNSRTNGDYYGVPSPFDYQGPALVDNWFPRFQNNGDHDDLAEAVFGFGVSWRDIATIPSDGSPPIARDPANQSWVDRWNNFDSKRRVLNYCNVSENYEEMQLDVPALIFDRYNVDLFQLDTQQLMRAEHTRVDHFTVFSCNPGEETGLGWILSWEDLFNAGDRDYDDLNFYTNRPPSLP